MSSAIYIGGRQIAGTRHRSEQHRARALSNTAPKPEIPSLTCPCEHCREARLANAGGLEPGAHEPLRTGEPWADDDGLVYRVVDDAVICAPGWSSDRSWGAALGIKAVTEDGHRTTWPGFRHLVQRGAFDAAIGMPSGERRYRCLSPSRAKEMLREWEKKVRR